VPAASETEEVMSELINRLVAAVLSGSGEPVDPGLVPTVVAIACADVLHVDGAGLSLIGELRVPLAASNPEVRRAEQLQTTLGEGPCLTAVAQGEALTANPDQMRERWPVFDHELRRQTGFRSVAALPLGRRGEPPFGAIDLYFNGAEPDGELLEDSTLRDIIRVVTTFITGAPVNSLLTGADTTPMLAGSGGIVAERMNVWTAVGVLMGATGMGQPEALAMLRAHAFSNTTTLDELAHLITTHQLSVEEVAH
jgi:hypothetical protein